MSGQVMKFANWSPGEPSNEQGKDCVLMDMFTGQWHNFVCNNTRVNVICEYIFKPGNYADN